LYLCHGSYNISASGHFAAFQLAHELVIIHTKQQSKVYNYLKLLWNWMVISV